MAHNNTMYCWQYCPQLRVPPSGNEDCLFLHLFRPRSWRKSPKPLNVIVFIHGGGLYSGTNNPYFYGPEYFMETQEVILVSPTYRTNVFGFLATGDDASPGNYGIKDIIMSLRWIQENIGAFGGDPDQVTLIGHSGGSTAVHYMMLSQLAKGLFKNVIMMSGMAITPWGVPIKKPREFINVHARYMEMENPEKLTNHEIVERFRQMPPDELVSGMEPMKEWNDFPITSYLPSVEPVGTPNALITEHPFQILESGTFLKVPALSNFVDLDGLNFIQPLILADRLYSELNEEMYERLPIVLYMDEKNPRIREVVDKVRAKYFGPTGFIDEESMDGALRMVTDLLFVRPFFQAYSLMGKHNDKPMYGFKYTYKSEMSMAAFYTAQDNFTDRAVHGNEIISLMKVNLLFPDGPNKRDKVDQMRLMKIVLDFAKYNDPGLIAWDQNDPKITLLRNDDANIIGSDVLSAKDFSEECKFWDYMETILVEGEKECPKV